MNKELFVTSTPHETKVAMTEDDQLAEIYLERENEYILAGSIYKGRVTRVLPGMQSAFVDIGLERDAFLYVSDFFEMEEDDEDMEEAVTKGTPMPALSAPAAGAVHGSANGAAYSATEIETELEIGEEEDEEEAGGVDEFQSGSESDGSNGGATGDPAPSTTTNGSDQGSTASRENRGGQRRRRGRRGRNSSEPRTRDAAPSTAESNRSDSSGAASRDMAAGDTVGSAETTAPYFSAVPRVPAAAQTYAPMVLPGESISKYRRQATPAAPIPATAAMAAEATPTVASDAEPLSGPQTVVEVVLPESAAPEVALPRRESRPTFAPMVLPGETIRKYRQTRADIVAVPESAAEIGMAPTPEAEPRAESHLESLTETHPQALEAPFETASEMPIESVEVASTEAASVEVMSQGTPEVIPEPVVAASTETETEPATEIETKVEVAAVISETSMPVPVAEAPDAFSSIRVTSPRSSAFVMPGESLAKYRRRAKPVTEAEASTAAEKEKSQESVDTEALVIPEAEAQTRHEHEPTHAEASEVVAAESHSHPMHPVRHDTFADTQADTYADTYADTHEQALAAELHPETAETVEASEVVPQAVPHVDPHAVQRADAYEATHYGEQAAPSSSASSHPVPWHLETESVTADESHSTELTSALPDDVSVTDFAEERAEAEREFVHFVAGRNTTEEEVMDEEEAEAEMQAYSSEVDEMPFEEFEEEIQEAHAFARSQSAAGMEASEGSYGEDGSDEDEGDETDSEDDEGDTEEGDGEGEADEIDEAQAEAEAERYAAGDAGANPAGRSSATRSRFQQRNQRSGRNDRNGGGPRRGGFSRSGGGGPRRGAPHRDSGPRPQISDLLKEGQEILVQIAKEPIAKKGARITSHIALPGRFLVYMPTVNHVGVSRKIASDEERMRLKRIVVSERENGVGGFIVRTAAQNCPEDELRADIRFLKNLWLEIKQRSEAKKPPALIYHDLNVVERVLRDQVTRDFTTIWVDTEVEYERVLRFATRFQPSLVRRIKLWSKSTPLFDQFGVTEEYNKALKSKVWLKSGGYIVINQTEALVAIDVNTGKYVGKTTRLEDTITKTNIDAISEIVRQIRLRDLGGIIILDFIDMDERRNRQRVMLALEEALKRDRAPSKVLQFNDFGLVAITRKRVKQSLERTVGAACEYCTGTGFVKSANTICNEIYVEMRKITPQLTRTDVMLRVNPEVGKILKSNNGRWIQELEELTSRTLIIKSDPLVHQEHFDIT